MPPFVDAHGRSAELGQTTVWESTPTAALASPPEGGTIDLNAGRDAQGRIRSSETARQLARLRHARPDFVREEIACAPDFKPFNDRRRDLVRHRVAELFGMFGHVSAGVGSILRGWGWAISFGEYFASKAAATGCSEFAELASKMLSRASVENAKAFEIADREAKARPKPKTPGEWLGSGGEQ